jgi:hypothetical protein
MSSLPASAAWTSSQDLRGQLSRLWERGKLLRGVVTQEAIFPLRLTLRGPTSNELATQFEAVRNWIANLTGTPGIRIEWRSLTHRILGSQRMPQSIWVDTLADALALIGRTQVLDRFERLVALTRSQQPQLLPWLADRPLEAIECAADWDRLLAVVEWMMRHPRPGIYLRQVDIPAVHSKFVEAHRAILMQLLDLSLPPEAVAADKSGVSQFAARYGFLDKPVRIRFRLLDPEVSLLRGPKLPDLTLDATSFALLEPPVKRVFITENETNFLALPPASAAMVIFGGGYGWDALAKAEWLARCSLHYWGDIDTHGFAILDQLRSRFGHVKSFLMDRATLMAHESLWGEESDQCVRDLPTLTETEAALFNDLRDNRIRRNLRLEQERVGFLTVAAALEVEARQASSVEPY